MTERERERERERDSYSDRWINIQIEEEPSPCLKQAPNEVKREKKRRYGKR